MNRLRLLLPKVVSPNQSSFIPGRNITDYVIIYQEVLHSFKARQGTGKGMMIKLDLEKAYNRLKWSFVEDMLKGLRLPPNLIKVIMLCISSTSFKILWNGETSYEILPSKGLRQGDRLSPYLFVLCLERLGHFIEEKVSSGEWQPIQLSRERPKLSHICFADDVILFAKADISQACVVRECLQSFCQDFGQKASF